VVEIPFVLTDHNNWLLDVVVNDVDSLKLMLHTAATDVMLTEAGVKKTKSIAFTASNKVKSWGGSADSRLSESNRIQIGTIEVPKVMIWEDKNSGHGSDGKFGLDAFGDRVVEVDFDRSRLKIHSVLPDDLNGFEGLELESNNGSLTVAGQCVTKGNVYPHRFLVHSGYSGGLLLDDEFAKNSGVGSAITITEETKLKDSFGNEIPVRKGTLELFRLGDQELRNVPIGFFGGGTGIQKTSLLGGGILKQYHLFFDLPKKRLYVKRRQDTPT
jgi:hypothetical protein